MAQGISLIVYPTKDLDSAKAVFGELLGVEPYADAPYYVGFRVGDQEVGLDPNGSAKAAGPIGYADVDDIEGRLAALVAAGATQRQPVTDVGGGNLIALLADADGNVFGLRKRAG